MTASDYIGIPFLDKGRSRDGCDCWGLVYMVYRDLLHVAIPTYVENYTTAQDREEIRRLINQERGAWSPLSQTATQFGDVIVLRMSGRPWHVGLVVEAPWFIHADPKIGVVRERWDSAIWQHRVEGWYRHPSLLEERVA